MKKRTNLAAFLAVLLFACAADGLMDQLGLVGFTLAGTAVMGTAWGLVEYKEAKRMIQTWYRRNGEWIPERPLEPADCWTPEPEDRPACQCSKCKQDVWPGERTYGDGSGSALCKECFTELLRDMMEHNLSEMAELLGYDVMLQV